MVSTFSTQCLPSWFFHNNNAQWRITRKEMYLQRNIEERSGNHSCGKINIAYSQCVHVALSIQHAMSMRRVILSSVSCPPLQYISTLSYKRQNFREKNLPDIKRVFWLLLPTLSETFIILSTERDMIKMCTCPYVMYPLFLSGFNETLTFSTDFWKILKHRSSGSRNFLCRWKDRRWEMTTLIVAFRNFANAPKHYENAQ